ncbi:MAG: hypothetical protein HQK76_08000 [Desulfobacterales bacterium]|nr:hypothetical protein [Desulfobacterales bacterium]
MINLLKTSSIMKRLNNLYDQNMDDFILFDDQKSALKNYLSLMKSFLREKLELDLKENIQLNKTKKRHSLSWISCFSELY